MNDRRLSRLKLLTTGAALLSTTVFAGNPPAAAPAAPAEPVYVNSPAPQKPVATDAGVVTPVKPKPEPKPTPINVNSPKPKP